MAEIIRCEQGHYYDKAVFDRCPHCVAGINETENTAEYKKEIGKLALEYLKEQLLLRQRTGKDEPEEEAERTVAFAEPVKHEVPEEEPERTVAFQEPVRQEKQEAEPQKAEPQKAEPARAAASEDGKTIGFSNGSQKNYFVTGWLVCIDGPDTGHTFNLYYGYNTIGYSRNNQICLMEDLEVAKKIHCSVVYEDRKNRFFLIPEEDHATFLNSRVIEEATELRSGDVIRIGSSQLEFIAFCRGERKWKWEDMQKVIKRR